MTADNPAFEYLLRAANYIQTAGPTPSQDEMETALSLINTALGTESGNAARGTLPLTQDIADIQAQIGTSRSSIEQANSRHSDFQIYLTQNIADVKTVDVAQTLTQVSSYTTQLQASYMTPVADLAAQPAQLSEVTDPSSHELGPDRRRRPCHDRPRSRSRHRCDEPAAIAGDFTVATRFGPIAGRWEDVIEMPQGPLGFTQHRRFALLTVPIPSSPSSA